MIGDRQQVFPFWPDSASNTAVQPAIDFWIVKCRWCGEVHHGEACPKVESVEYHENGAVKRVIFRNGDREFENMEDFLSDLDEKEDK